jgi:hypothetical protein
MRRTGITETDGHSRVFVLIRRSRDCGCVPNPPRCPLNETPFRSSVLALHFTVVMSLLIQRWA